MYKELYKKDTNISGTSSSTYLISMNESMKTMLSKYKIEYMPPVATAIPSMFNKYLKDGVELRVDDEEELNCYMYKSEKHFAPFYEIKSGNECSNNEIYIWKYKKIGYAFRVCLNFVYALAKLLEGFPEKFNIILNFDWENKSFKITFHCIRENEEWLDENLDHYQMEALFVLTTKYA